MGEIQPEITSPPLLLSSVEVGFTSPVEEGFCGGDLCLLKNDRGKEISEARVFLDAEQHQGGREGFSVATVEMFKSSGHQVSHHVDNRPGVGCLAGLGDIIPRSHRRGVLTPRLVRKFAERQRALAHWYSRRLGT